MKIIFIGQRGIPATGGLQHERENRVEAIAIKLAKIGHKVTVKADKSFISSSVKNWHGVEIVRKNVLWLAWKQQPDVIHVHGWKLAGFAWLLALLSPQSTLIWTVDELPERTHLILSLISWQAKRVFDVITTPTRTMQYRLLTQLNLSVAYIPDGYGVPSIPDISLNNWRIRRNQYVVAYAAKGDQLAVKRAYKVLRTRQRLLFVSPETTLRVATTLLRNAGVVIFASPTPVGALLQAMDAGRAIIATTNSVHEETLGTAAKFITSGSTEQLAKLLKKLVVSKQDQLRLGVQAALRAQSHFGWYKIILEYLAAYYSTVLVPVSVDSIILKNRLGWRNWHTRMA